MMTTIAATLLSLLMISGDQSAGHYTATATHGGSPISHKPNIVPFAIVSDPEATELLRKRLHNNVPTAVPALATHYAINGYRSMAALFADGGFGNTTTTGGERVMWGCPDPGTEFASSETTAIVSLRGNGRFGEAATRAESALEKEPGSCQLQVEWAASVLMQELSTKAVPTNDLERAIRILVTGACEVVLTPMDSIGPGQTLRDVAVIFRLHHDDDDALRCLDLARNRVDDQLHENPPLLIKAALEKLRGKIVHDAEQLVSRRSTK